MLDSTVRLYKVRNDEERNYEFWIQIHTYRSLSLSGSTLVLGGSGTRNRTRKHTKLGYRTGRGMVQYHRVVTTEDASKYRYPCPCKEPGDPGGTERWGLLSTRKCDGSPLASTVLGCAPVICRTG